MIDCLEQDGANTLLLWTAGAFRSKKFPITWKYNADHKNVEHDFVGDLIEYAICYCADCREKFFDREFEFVKAISADVWQAKPDAAIVVYPHYFLS